MFKNATEKFSIRLESGLDGKIHRNKEWKFTNANSMTGWTLQVSEQKRNGLHDFTSACCRAASFKGSVPPTGINIPSNAVVHIYAHHTLYMHCIFYAF